MRIEWLKIRRNRSNIAFLLLFLFILLVPLFLARNDRETADQFKKSYWEVQLSLKREAADSTKEISEAIHVHESLLTEIELIQQIVHSIDSGNDDERLSAELEYETLIMDRIENGSLVGIEPAEQELTVAQLDFLTQVISDASIISIRIKFRPLIT